MDREGTVIGSCRIPGCDMPVEDMGESLCWRHAHLLAHLGSTATDRPTPHALYTPEVVDRLIREAPRPMMPVPIGTGPIGDDDGQEAGMSAAQYSNETNGTTEPRVRINLDRGQRGGYGWSITVRGEDANEVMSLLKATDLTMRDTYLVTTEEEG